MALIKCPECGKKISGTCTTCIHCGYAIPSGAVELEKDEETGKVGVLNFLKKYKRSCLIVAILLVVVLIASLSGGKKNLFDKLYAGQSRESVHKQYGQPVDSDYTDKGDNYNIDTYADFNFLGKKGTLSVWYDKYNTVSHAFFSCCYSEMNPSSKDKDEMRQYVLKVIEFYTKKYGTPAEGRYYLFEWTLEDGTELMLEYDLDATYLNDAVCLYWTT